MNATLTRRRLGDLPAEPIPGSPPRVQSCFAVRPTQAVHAPSDPAGINGAVPVVPPTPLPQPVPPGPPSPVPGPPSPPNPLPFPVPAPMPGPV